MFGIELTPEHPIERIVDFAVAAEEAGFEAALVSSHYFNRDPWPTLTRIATETDDMAIGPAAANPYEVHPVRLASQMASLQEVSNGRAIFGIGPGDETALGSLGIERDKPLRRVLESFSVARDLFAGERVSTDGTFTTTDAGLEYDVEGEIPIYVGAQGPHMCRMSAKHADGLLYNGAHPRDVRWGADRVAEGLEERPAERGDFDFTVYASVSVADDEDAARDAARPPVAFIAADAPEPVLDRHDLDSTVASDIGTAIERGDFGTAFETVTPAMLDAFAIAGTPVMVADQLAAILEIADGVVVGTPLGPDIEAAIPLATEAIQHARNRI